MLYPVSVIIIGCCQEPTQPVDPLADTQADLIRLFGSLPQKCPEKGKGGRKKSVSFDKKSKKKHKDDKVLDALESEGKL